MHTHIHMHTHPPYRTHTHTIIYIDIQVSPGLRIGKTCQKIISNSNPVSNCIPHHFLCIYTATYTVWLWVYIFITPAACTVQYTLLFTSSVSSHEATNVTIHLKWWCNDWLNKFYSYKLCCVTLTYIDDTDKHGYLD